MFFRRVLLQRGGAGDDPQNMLLTLPPPRNDASTHGGEIVSFFFFFRRVLLQQGGAGDDPQRAPEPPAPGRRVPLPRGRGRAGVRRVPQGAEEAPLRPHHDLLPGPQEPRRPSAQGTGACKNVFAGASGVVLFVLSFVFPPPFFVDPLRSTFFFFSRES